MADTPIGELGVRRMERRIDELVTFGPRDEDLRDYLLGLGLSSEAELRAHFESVLSPGEAVDVQAVAACWKWMRHGGPRTW